MNFYKTPAIILSMNYEFFSCIQKYVVPAPTFAHKTDVLVSGSTTNSVVTRNV